MQNVHLDRVGIAGTYFKKPKKILKHFCLWYQQVHVDSGVDQGRSSSGSTGLLKFNGNMFLLLFDNLSYAPMAFMECYFHLWENY